MLCQACEKNETTLAVICENCVSHYASIREGHYQERDLTIAEHRYVVRSWIQVAAPTHKRATRDDKAPKKGLFGKKAAPEAAPVAEEVPPPDWKNRVFPLPDAPGTTPAATAAVAAPAPEPIAPAADYTTPVANEYGYDQAVAEPEPSPAVSFDEPSPVLDLTPNAPVAPTPEPEAPAVHAIEEVVPQAVVAEPEPEPAIAPPADLTNFFNTLAQPAAEPVSAPEPEPAAPSPELASFFEGLGQAAPAETPAEPAAEPSAAAAPDLSSFFASLGTPAQPEPAAPAPAEAEAASAPAPVSELASFFESLSAPAAQPDVPSAPVAAPSEVSPEPIAPVSFEPAAEVAFTPNATPEPAAPTSGPAAPEADLTNFFESLAGPTAQPAAPVEAPAPIEPPAPVQPTGIDLSGFFESLANPAPAPAPTAPQPDVARVEDAMEQTRDANAQPFSFELSMPPAPTGPAGARPADLKPPTHGQPFTIDLTPPPPPPTAPTRANAEAAELKRRLSSTGELSFADDDEDEPSDDGLLSGLSYSGGAKPASGFSIARDDDEDDDARTIEL